MVGICQLCKRYSASIQKHHLFSNTKLNRKMYGDLIDSEVNIIGLCESCHLWKAIPKFTEKQFCEALGITTRSKSGRL